MSDRSGAVAAVPGAPRPVRAPGWLVPWSDPWPPDRPLSQGRRATWWWRLLIFVAVSLVTGAAVAVLCLLAGASITVMAATSQLVGVSLGYLVLCSVEGRRPPFELAPRRWSGLWFGLVAGLVACAVVVGLLVVLGLREFTGTSTSFPVWIPLLVLGLTAGVSEELMFRGVLYRFVEQSWGTWWATAVSGLFFGVAHLGNPHATVQGAIAIAIEAGVLFALIYALTRNLWLLIGFHAAWNLAQGMLFGSVVSGTSTEQPGWLVSHPRGPDWLSGGGFGIEASPITVLVLGGLSVFCAVLLVRTNRIVPRRKPADPMLFPDPA